jgi:transcriptional regulator with XRE-family HTH domain
MTPRTWEQVGDLIRRRRDALGLTREATVEKANRLVGSASLSTANVTILEKGRRDSYRPRTLIGIARALDWSDDAVERLLAGVDPEEVEVGQDEPIFMDASGANLQRVREEDPEYYALLEDLARRHLDQRAR